MADTTPQASQVKTFSTFVALIRSEKAKEDLLSLVYSKANTSTVLGRISELARANSINVDLGQMEGTIPKSDFIDEREHPQEEEKEEGKEKRRDDGTTTGPLINRDKYESEIMETLEKQRENEAIRDFSNAKTPEEREKIFREILGRYSDGERIIQEQHQQLLAQMGASEQGKSPKKGEDSGSKRLKDRIDELQKTRAQEQEEYSSLLNVEIVRKHHELTNLRREAEDEKDKSVAREKEKEIKNREKDFKSLSKDQRKLITRYDTLHLKLRYRHTGDFHDRPEIFEHFKELEGKPEAQAKFLQELIHSQHTAVRSEVWAAFDQKERRRFSEGYKKTLTRAQRRSLLGRLKTQSSPSASISRSMLDRIFRRFFPDFSQFYSSPSPASEMNSGNSDSSSILDNIQQAQNLADGIDSLLGNGAAEAATGAGAAEATAAPAAAAAASSPVWGTAAVIIGIILCVALLVFIVIMVVTGNTDTNPVPSYSQVDCNDQTIKPEDIDTGDRMIKIIANRFHITVPSGIFYSPNDGPGQNVDPTKANPTPELITTFKAVCRLFGHVNGSSTDNTFGKLFTTHFNNTDQNLLNFSGDNSNVCSLDTESTPGSILHFTILNPLKCSSTQLEYYIDKGLAFALAGFMQADSNSVLKDFANSVYKSSPQMPTNGCQNPGTKSGFNKEDYCFADMVGEYFVYPFFLDTTPPGISFTDYPNQYANFYSFAKQNLFDGVDFISLTEAGAIACPTARPQNPQEVNDILLRLFNIKLIGPGAGNFSLALDVYDAVCAVSGYKYIELLHVPRVHIDINIEDQTGCSGHTIHNGTDAYIVNHFFDCGGNKAGNEFIITHELGHIIQWENPDLVNSFCGGPFHSAIRTGHCDETSSSVGIPTFNCLLEYGQSVPSQPECFSDMVGEYLYYTQFIDRTAEGPKDAYKMANFPTNFPEYYNFAKENIFVPIGTSTEANTQTCGGKYTLDNPLKKNFGDAVCNFNKGDLAHALNNQDPQNASYWFNVVVPCESGYDPNAYFRCDASGQKCTPDPAGAWGLFQMGQGANGQYDHGDVYWVNQVSNAVSYNNSKNQNFRYWECAKDKWK